MRVRESVGAKEANVRLALLLAQHAHYTMHVRAAPFAVWAAHEAARRVLRAFAREE